MTCHVPMDTPTGQYEVRLACSDEGGQKVEMNYEQWPQIIIKGQEEWNGGMDTQTLQRLAVGGNVNISAFSGNGTVTLAIDSLANPTTDMVSGLIAIAICNTDGTMLSQPAEPQNISVSGYNVKRSVSVSTPISRHIPNGRYQLRIGFLPFEETLWTFCDQILSEGLLWWADYQPFYISMTMKDGQVKIADDIEFEGAETSWTSGISAFEQDASLGEGFYDLYGQKTSSTRHGVYIRKIGNKVTKIIR